MNPRGTFRGGTLRRSLLVAAIALLTGGSVLAERQQHDRSTACVSVTDFLPQGFVTDGSVSYQPQIQQALDHAAKTDRNVIFPPMVYRLDDEQGLKLHSNMTLSMYGATIQLAEQCSQDGQAFYGRDVADVQFRGGRVVGRNDRWPGGVNLRGIYLSGTCKRIRICDMQLRDLSSNGIGVFGKDDDHPAEDIWVIDTIVDNCCNIYGDYQAPEGQLRGPEKGSVREDQGLVAMYFVREFVVRGCRLEDSRSDGTHFYRCRNGQFVANRVHRAKMGGYFVETCQHVLAADNLIRDNGSRGVTIERGSRACTLKGNTVEQSGREGLWIPDCTHCVVTGNLFLRNGRKPNGPERHTIWNANITIDSARHDPTDSPTCNYLIADNIIDTASDQVAAIRVDAVPGTTGIIIKGNLLLGENQQILVEGPQKQSVLVEQNHTSTPAR